MFRRAQNLHAHTGKPIKFEFTLSDISVQLSADNSVSVSVDNIQLMWVRGGRSACTKRARVVERLDQATGALSRNAHLMVELSLPCTLFRHGGADDVVRWDPKPSELLLTDADADPDADPILCKLPVDLSAFATSSGLTRRLELPLPFDYGHLTCSLHTRQLSGQRGADTCSNAGSEASDITELGDAAPRLEALARRGGKSADSSTDSVGGAPSASGAPAPSASGGLVVDSAEARWQQVRPPREPLPSPWTRALVGARPIFTPIAPTRARCTSSSVRGPTSSRSTASTAT